MQNICRFMQLNLSFSLNLRNFQMFAVIEIAGQQFKVGPNAKLYVPKLAKSVGDNIKIEKVLLFSDGKETRIGNPTLKGVKVEAQVLGHEKDDTVIVFKKKRRKGYRVRRGHRQQYTKIEITKLDKEN